jgi:hypothetical protein
MIVLKPTDNRNAVGGDVKSLRVQQPVIIDMLIPPDEDIFTNDRVADLRPVFDMRARKDDRVLNHSARFDGDIVRHDGRAHLRLGHLGVSRYARVAGSQNPGFGVDQGDDGASDRRHPDRSAVPERSVPCWLHGNHPG